MQYILAASLGTLPALTLVLTVRYYIRQWQRRNRYLAPFEAYLALLERTRQN